MSSERSEPPFPLYACASCKHHRKRCDMNCELASYFPVQRYEEYLNAHRLFGLSNIMKLLNQVKPEEKKKTAESILFEANFRALDPVFGCVGYIHNLEAQIAFYQKELDLVKHQLKYHRKSQRGSTSEVDKTLDEMERYLMSSPSEIKLAGSPNMGDIGDQEDGGVIESTDTLSINRILQEYQSDGESEAVMKA